MRKAHQTSDDCLPAPPPRANAIVRVLEILNQ